jgi:hypothetical protein
VFQEDFLNAVRINFFMRKLNTASGGLNSGYRVLNAGRIKISFEN